MKISEFIGICLFVVLIPSAVLISSCDSDVFPDNKDTTCLGKEEPCRGFSWSFVDPDTYENLMGPIDKPIHPDTVVVLNMTHDTMYHTTRKIYNVDWWTVEFSPGPYQELNCFNQCVLDSAFSRYYYVYVGNQDWDTVEVHFPARTKYAGVMEVYFNDQDPRVPDDRTTAAFSSYWFQKKIK